MYAKYNMNIYVRHICLRVAVLFIIYIFPFSKFGICITFICLSKTLLVSNNKHLDDSDLTAI